MKRLLCMSVLAVYASSIGLSQVLMAQNVATNNAIQTGFAVITPLSGGGQGLSVTETFGELLSGNVSQASVLPSPLVTLTNLVVSLDPQSGKNVGLAIVNPNDTPATIVLRIANAQGVDIGTRAIIIGGRQQFSAFVTDLFPEVAASGPMAGFLFISSDITIAVLGLAFDGLNFSALPIASQFREDGVGTFVLTPTVTPASVITSPEAFVFSNTFSTQALPSTINQLPSTFTGLAPTEPVSVIPPPIGVTTQPITALTFSAAAIGVGVTTPFPLIDTSVGGPGALVLPQIATGGGWVSLITIANTTSVAQVVRIDFFNPFGGPLVLPFGPSIPTIVVPAGGVITISTNGR